MARPVGSAVVGIRHLLAAITAISVMNATGCSTTSRSSFYVEHASLVKVDSSAKGREDFTDANALPIAMHRLQKGDGVVIGVREFSGGSMFTVDDESFRKMTIFIAESTLASGHYSLTDGNAIAYLSQGGSAKPSGGCFGRAKDGRVVIKKVDNSSVHLALTASFEMSSPLGWPGTCAPKELDIALEVEKREFEQLTAWEGRITTGTTLGQELFP